MVRRGARLLWLCAVGVGFACAQQDPPIQPFPYNHQVHIENDVDCLACHFGLVDPEEHRFPQMATCLECHDKEPPVDNPLLVRLSELAKEDTWLEWDPALRLPDHVFFSHVRHVDVAEIDCLECHGDMPARTVPPATRRVVTMAACIDCHEHNTDRVAATRATLDCLACHR